MSCVVLHLEEGNMSASGVNYFSILKQVDFGRIFEVISYLYKYVFSSWGLILPSFISVFVWSIYRKEKSNDKSFFILTFLSILLLFLGTLIFSYAFPQWREIPDSARRMSMFFIPMMIYYLALAIKIR